MIYQKGDKAVTRNNLARCVLTVTQGGSERAAPTQAGLADTRLTGETAWMTSRPLHQQRGCNHGSLLL